MLPVQRTDELNMSGSLTPSQTTPRADSQGDEWVVLAHGCAYVCGSCCLAEQMPIFYINYNVLCCQINITLSDGRVLL